MNNVFDLTTIFFLVLAVVIFLKLRSVLGRRTGQERPPYDPYSPREAANDDKVVTLPGVRKSGSRAATAAAEAPELPESWGDLAPAGSPLAEGLSAIAAADPAFDPEKFLDGARMAYEMIVTAFAEGNSRQLRSLLNTTVYDGFAAAIADREARGETVSSTFIGIDDATIVEAGQKGTDTRVTVKFRSSLISVTRDSDGEVIDGDEKKVREVTDIWTFERSTRSRDPNWKLVATEAAN
jgi:predicted lipid-binding transport protein (Tim44 family)